MLKVIIADDSDLLRERVRNALKSIPNISVVAEAHNTLVAKKVVAEHQPDLLILDIRMPGGSGLEAIEKLKAISPRTKIIVLTNYNYPQYKEKSFEAGADYFCSKSEEFERIYEIANELLNANSTA
ncbi:MAG: response regulator transcription factor [Melioribacteraceae bacterium]|nr:response regulator transcription factor [Melioribacteraceae bacterium]